MDVSNAPYHHPTPWDTQFPLHTLPELFEQTTHAAPDAPFLHFLGRTYSYRDIYTEAQQFASGLIEAGIQKGDRVGLFLPNVPIYASAYYGAMMAGAIVVNFSPLYTVEELAWQVGDSGTKLLVTLDVPELYKTASEVLECSELETLVVGALSSMLPTLKGIAFKLLKRSQIATVKWSDNIQSWESMLGNWDWSQIGKPVAGRPSLDAAEDLALLQYTGGTTGRPKGAMLGHSQLATNAQQVAAINPFGEPDKEVFMGALPFFHVFANTALLNHAMVSGASIAMVPRFETRQVLQTIERYKATGFPGVPTMFQAMLDHPDLAKTDLSSLKVCISGGAPMPAPVHTRFEEVTGVRVSEGYGLTESSGVVSANPYVGERMKGSIGQLVAGTEVLLLDKEDPTKLAPEGEPGELVVHGPQVMRGYWNRPDAAADAFAEHNGKTWLRTGDVAQWEEGGWLRIVDRIKDMIAVGGFKVFPSQVEDVLEQHEAIKEVLVIGVPDEYLGERPKAFVSLNEGADITEEALCEWANAQLGKHERLVGVAFRDELPKTLIGKLDRKTLRAQELTG